MWHRQLQMVGLSKVTCKRSGNKLPSFIPTVPFWALQVLSQWHQCRWSRRPAGSLAELSPGEVGLSLLLENSVLCVAASSQWRVACAAWCTRHPQGGVAPHPWPRRLEAASGAVGGCGGCGVARGDGWIAVHNLWVFAFIWAFWQVRYDDLAPVYISMSPLYMRLPVGKRLEILQEILKYFWGNRLHPIVVIWNVQLKDGLSILASPSGPKNPPTSDVFFDPWEETFYNSLRHARKDLLSKWFETDEGSNWSILIIISICFDLLWWFVSVVAIFEVLPSTLQQSRKELVVGFDKAIGSPFWLLACQAPPKTAMHDAWQKTPIGSEKWSLATLERQKCLRCGAEKNHAVPRCIEAPAFFHQNPNFVGQTMDCSMPRGVKTWSGSRSAYMLCSLSWLSVLQPLVCSMRGTT